MNPSTSKRAKNFEQLALPHLPSIYRLGRQMTDEQTAQDLVQETYLRAWKYFDTFDPKTNCRAWLYRILHNVWADRWRRLRLEIPLGDREESAEPAYNWEDEFMRNELSPEIKQALSDLPENYRWAVLLADVEEFSYQQIADIMECPIGTVMSRINRGRRLLAERLQSHPRHRARRRRTVKSLT